MAGAEHRERVEAAKRRFRDGERVERIRAQQAGVVQPDETILFLLAHIADQGDHIGTMEAEAAIALESAARWKAVAKRYRARQHAAGPADDGEG